MVPAPLVAVALPFVVLDGDVVPLPLVVAPVVPLVPEVVLPVPSPLALLPELALLEPALLPDAVSSVPSDPVIEVTASPLSPRPLLDSPQAATVVAAQHVVMTTINRWQKEAYIMHCACLDPYGAIKRIDARYP